MTLIEGAIKTIINADELFDEARLLADAGHFARAVLLHQISLEECGKAELLHVSLSEVLRGQSVDLKQLSKVLAKHAAKNKTNAYFLPKSEAEVSAGEQSDLKNASLYVDFDGMFKAPSEVITKEHLAEVLDRNGQFMSIAMDRLRLVTRWSTDLDAAAGEVATLWAELSMDTLDRNKPETFEALSKRLEGMFAALEKKT